MSKEHIETKREELKLQRKLERQTATDMKRAGFALVEPTPGSSSSSSNHTSAIQPQTTSFLPVSTGAAASVIDVKGLKAQDRLELTRENKEKLVKYYFKGQRRFFEEDQIFQVDR
eukprot:GSA25T00015854001.1